MWLRVMGPHDRASVALGGRPLVLGRDAQCDVVLHDPRVAPRHALLQPSAQGVEVADFGGTTGVFVDGWAVQRALLLPGHALRVGATEVTLEWRDERLAAPQALPHALPQAPVPAGQWAAAPAGRSSGALLGVVAVLVALAALGGLGGAGVMAYRWLDDQAISGSPGGGGKPASGARPGGRAASSPPGAAIDIEPLNFDRNPFEED
jgi:hypothetical protein